MEPFRKQGPALALMPSVDAIEKDDVFEVTADLPGVDEKNIEVKLSGDVLTIKGEREERKEEKKKDYYVSERQFGVFERSFQVPENVESRQDRRLLQKRRIDGHSSKEAWLDEGREEDQHPRLKSTWRLMGPAMSRRAQRLAWLPCLPGVRGDSR